MEAFGTRLKKLRSNQGLSVAAAARKVGVPVSTYREWEFGRAIQGEPYPAIAKMLGVSLNELFNAETQDRSGVFEKLDAVEEAVSNLKKHLLSSV